jgi:hypothetical protein
MVLTYLDDLLELLRLDLDLRGDDLPPRHRFAEILIPHPRLVSPITLGLALS